MAVEIKVPSVGESITEGTISSWLKQDGDTVAADDPLFELETDKATTPVPAPAAGRLKISVGEGETVAIGQVVGRIEEGEAADEGKEARKPRGEKRGGEKPKDEGPKDGDGEEAAPPEGGEGQEVLLSPAARHLAEEKGVDVSRLQGSGRDGRVLKEDVQAFLDKGESSDREPLQPGPEERAVPAEKAPLPGQRETRERMSSIRARIADRLVTAQQTAAILTTFNEADLSAVLDLRARYKEAFKEKHGVGLGILSFFVKACVEALGAFPVVNARIDGNEVVYHHYCNIGVAVSTERGLMVPVLRDAQDMSLARIEARIAELAGKARSGRIAVDDLQGGTFTITNGGVFGSMLSTPLLNFPQSGILGMHAIQKRPVAVGDQVVIRPMMYLALSYDHRLVDGRDAVGFLVRVKECVESPERMLLGI